MASEFRQLREQLGLTQQAMADRMGITRAYYGQLELGQKEPSGTLLSMIEFMRRADAAEKRLKEVDTMGESRGVYAPIVSPVTRRPTVIADPHSFALDARTAGVLEKIEDHVDQLRELIERDPGKADVVWFLLRKHLAIEDLQEK